MEIVVITKSRRKTKYRMSMPTNMDNPTAIIYLYFIQMIIKMLKIKLYQILPFQFIHKNYFDEK